VSASTFGSFTHLVITNRWSFCCFRGILGRFRKRNHLPSAKQHMLLHLAYPIGIAVSHNIPTRLLSIAGRPPIQLVNIPFRNLRRCPTISSVMAPKRKAPASYADSTGSKSNKRSSTATPSRSKDASNGTHTSLQNGSSKSKGTSDSNNTRVEEVYGIVQREFYPAEISNERCKMYNDDEIARPIEVLAQTMADTKAARQQIKPGRAVLHYFKRDLRLNDNKALSMAAELAKKENIPLICLFVVSPQDYQAHLTSPARVDFELRTLELMRQDLAELDVPLLVVMKEKRWTVPGFILEICDKWDVKHVFANIEYEVDELRRETKLTKMCLDKGIAFEAVHDDVVVAPGELSTGQGKQYAVYSPWFRSWIAHVHAHPELLEAFPKPGMNPKGSRDRLKEIFDTPIPNAPDNKKLSAEEKKRFQKLWPAGEHEAYLRLQKFLNQKVSKYKDNRNFPAGHNTAVVSVHHSVGTLAARTSIRMARDANSTKRLDGGNPGIVNWISEVAWRDFYKHVLAHWPYVCMHKPFKYEYTNIEWEYDDAAFDKWCKGMTGFPIGEQHLLHSDTLYEQRLVLMPHRQWMQQCDN
jgi:deoxyribodipyrimidine photo-lyase